ncbi:hypothetical protein GW17_00051299 [Ensete ventricosum]|nr:hypothetical protein GW17_00051299 [Ensete ventricosum]
MVELLTCLLIHVVALVGFILRISKHDLFMSPRGPPPGVGDQDDRSASTRPSRCRGLLGESSISGHALSSPEVMCEREVEMQPRWDVDGCDWVMDLGAGLVGENATVFFNSFPDLFVSLQ